MMHEKKNLIADSPAKQLSEKLINDRYAHIFDGATRYCSTELGLFQVDSGNCFDFLCMAFRTTSGSKDQVLYQLVKRGEIHIQKYPSRESRKRFL